MRLASLAAMQEAMGVANGEDSVNAMLSALETATANLGAALRFGSFDRAERQDDFFLRLDQQPADVPFAKLALSRGFVDAEAAVTVAASAIYTDLSAAPFDITAEVDIDREKGVVSIPVALDAGLGGGGWFRVAYTCGFTSDDQATYAGVPEWLARAAELDARIALNAHPSFVANATATDARMLERQLAGIVQGRMRYLPWATLPKSSRTT